MVADGIHILLGVALVAVLVRPDHVEAYLVVILAAGLPDLDRYLFAPLVYNGYLSGPIWTHRGITHSLAVMILVVWVAHAVGMWRPAAVGYGSHLVADFLTGGIRLLAPFSDQLYGLYYDWMLGNVIAGTFAALVIGADLAARVRSGDETHAVETRTGLGSTGVVGQLRRWLQ